VDSAGTPARLLNDRRDDRVTRDVGRHARLELVFARRRGRTVLDDAYAEPPFRVGRSFPEGDGLRMILAWTGPGIFGGDELEQTIRLEPGARVRLTSQSALQVHPSSRATLRTARLRCRYHVAEDARLHCHWDPLIPFAGASFEQQIELQLADSAELYWSDAFMAGRACAGPRPSGLGCASEFDGHANARDDGERWKFASLQHELRVLRGATLEYLERYRIAPADRHVTHPWVAGDACYFGTVVASGKLLQAAEAETLHDELTQVNGVDAAADRMDAKLLIARLIGRSGVPFHEARRSVTLRLGSS